MQAVVITRRGSPDAVAVETLPEPPLPGEGEVQVCVHAAGVNPNDAKLRRGAVALPADVAYPYVGGREAAGEVIRCGPGVEQLKVGDRVFGFFGWRASPGGHAERFTACADIFAVTPDNVDAVEAGGVSLAGITAYQALKALAPRPGSVVLVNGAGGGVGSLATQIAVAMGSRVVAILSEAKQEFLASLRADLVVDYEDEDAQARLRPFTGAIEYVIDTVGKGSLVSLSDALSPNVRVAQLASPSELSLGHESVVTAKPSRPDLDQLASLMSKKQLRCHVSAVLPSSRADEAHRLIETGHTQGKIILVPDP